MCRYGKTLPTGYKSSHNTDKSNVTTQIFSVKNALISYNSMTFFPISFLKYNEQLFNSHKFIASSLEYGSNCNELGHCSHANVCLTASI